MVGGGVVGVSPGPHLAFVAGAQDGGLGWVSLVALGILLCRSGLSAPISGTSLHSTVGSQDLYAVLKHPSEMTWITFPLLSLFREKRGRKKCDWEGWLEW